MMTRANASPEKRALPNATVSLTSVASGCPRVEIQKVAVFCATVQRTVQVASRLPTGPPAAAQALFHSSAEACRDRFLSIPCVVLALAHARISVRAESVLPCCDRARRFNLRRACVAPRRTAYSAASNSTTQRPAIMSVMFWLGGLPKRGVRWPYRGKAYADSTTS